MAKTAVQCQEKREMEVRERKNEGVVYRQRKVDISKGSCLEQVSDSTLTTSGIKTTQHHSQRVPCFYFILFFFHFSFIIHMCIQGLVYFSPLPPPPPLPPTPPPPLPPTPPPPAPPLNTQQKLFCPYL
jgi:hypothetical protein